VSSGFDESRFVPSGRKYVPSGLAFPFAVGVAECLVNKNQRVAGADMRQAEAVIVEATRRFDADLGIQARRMARTP
jgi:hypothetical protein